MMLDEARVARERLARAEAAKLNVEEATELAKKKSKLRDWEAVIKSLAESRVWLQQGGVLSSSVPSADSAKKSCANILERFSESPKNDTLVRNRGWINFLDDLESLKHNEVVQQRINWKEYFTRRLFGGASPVQRKQTLTLSLPANKDAFARYEYVYGLFSKYKSEVPNSKEQFLNVQAWSNQLAKINSEFVENADVPVAVQEFFTATSTSDGASLNLLTEEVITWLRTNNMLDNYAVRAR